MTKETKLGTITENFSWSEFECHCGCGDDYMDITFVNRLQRMREIYGKPIKINSGFRCEAHNKAIGGSKTSSHLKGLAVDIGYSGSTDRYELILAALEAGFNRIGIAEDFIHIDMDRTKGQRVAWLY